ncbi:MAG: hypothetical protein PHP44_12105, partial [Kiritimatiellae bacterium]|nr:hypothetical protein [Kiritimatiellia bacterium]
MKKQFARLFCGLGSLFITLLFVGCEVDSSESGSRNVDINVWGVYHGQDDYYDALVNNSSGSAPEYFDLRQYGDQLEAIDNHGIIFRGTIGSVNSDAKTCSFTLEGKTTAGNRVIVNGNINISGSYAIMEGTWIEDNLYALLYGKATAPAQPTNKTISLSISPNPVTAGSTATLTASNGSGSYPTWSVANTNLGTVGSLSGSTAQYNAKTNTGSQIVYVTDSAGSQ